MSLKLPAHFWRLLQRQVSCLKSVRKSSRHLWYCSMPVEASSSPFVKARRQLFFTRSRGLDRISPTPAAMKQHILRAALSRWPRIKSSALTTARASKSSRMGMGEKWPMETSVGNVATSPKKLLRAHPLFLQEGSQRFVQVFKSRRSVYSSVCLRWRLLPLGTGSIRGMDQSHVCSLFV